ncbi:class I SAM-dependent methyltransferase [Micromonospora sp. NPDC049903]|uniref:class I SAM-dependent methyltransferase n=1 Tax=Micromonospora sp. NPDC049903 TaxID=3364276 RepID=UPI0037B1B3AD
MTTETAVTLPGGEMPAWSDEAADAGPLATLVARLVPDGARVLLAGPHDPAVRKALTHTRITALLRGYPDAAALAGQVDRVVVAGVAGLPADEEYDLVLAAAGLDAMESVEGPRLGWDARLRRLAAAVRPGGTLLLRLDNPLGVHRLVADSPWYADRADAAWSVGGALDADRPASLDQLHVRLTDAGLRAGGCYAGYPRPDLTTALLATDRLTRHTDSGLFDALVQRSCAEGFDGRFVLADPARLAVDALHAGKATELAPCWLVLAQRGTDTPGPVFDGLPVALVRSDGTDGPVLEVVDGPQGWRWRGTAPTGPTTPATAPYASRQAAHRDPAAPDWPVPDGRLLRTLLLDGCLRRDTALLRRLLRGYADWLSGQAEQGRLGGAAALAGAENLVVASDRFAVLDPSWRAGDPLPVDVVLARTLWRFATDLVTGGYAHPWTSTLDVAGLTVVLGGVAGRDFDRAVVDAAVETEAAVGAAQRGLDAAGRADLDAHLHAVTPTDPPSGPRSYQQLHEAWRRQREENTRMAALLTWTEELLTSRERALRRAEATINLLSGSLSYKVGRLAVTPARLARRGARAAKRRARAALTPRQPDPKRTERS